jgi:hypothetical protein
MRIQQKLLLGLFVTGLAWAGLSQPTNRLYRNDFEQADLGKMPEDLQLLDGTFEVRQVEHNKFLELPGTPLNAFGFLFGPAEKDDVIASARVYATAKGRREPTFALGLNGVAGYRLQVNPARKKLELRHNDQTQATAPFDWQSGHWTHLQIAVVRTGATWTIRGKAWLEGKPEPNTWMISTEETKELPAGRASLFASPFSGTPLRFDDLEVRAAKP